MKKVQSRILSNEVIICEIYERILVPKIKEKMIVVALVLNMELNK